MRKSDLLGLSTALLLGAACALFAVRVAAHYQEGGALRAEWGRLRLTTLEPATRERLARLGQRVSATYYVSSREAMPSHMRRVERQVTDLLAAMHAAAPQRFDYQIVDPGERPDLIPFAANRKVAPFRERSVAGDAYSERTVFSALTLSFGTRPAAVIDGITPAVLPRLQRAIVAHLDQVEAPRAPRFALASPGGGAGSDYAELAEALAARGSLERVSLEGDEPFPAQADLLFWMAPRRVTPRRLEQLDRFLAAGRSVVVAGSLLATPRGITDGPEGPELLLEASPFDAAALWPHLGLAAEPGLFCDERADEVLVDGQPTAAPFAIRCIAPDQSFRRWRRQPNGTLLFALATPLALDGPKLARRGWRASVLATSSDDTWRVDVTPPSAVPLAALGRERGEDVPKQALAVELAPDDPWRGRVVALAATTPFEDGLLSRPHNAHRALVDTLVAELASDERLVIADAPGPDAAPLAPLSAGARLFWRFACVFALPLALLAAFFLRRERPERPAARRLERGAARPRRLRPLALALAATLAALALSVLVRRAGLRVDATVAQANALAGPTRALCSRAGQAGPIALTLAVSPRAALPPRWRPGIERLERRLVDLEHAGARFERRRIDPTLLPAEERARLAALGVERRDVVERDGETTTVRSVWASLVLEREGRSAVVSFADERDFEELEFRLAFALWKLETGRTPHVAFASDVPRLSAAEAHEHFQEKGLFAPSGVDVYSLARETLARAGYRVTHVNPRDPVLPADTDLLVWMQPRRSIVPMLEETLRYLHGGGAVLLAAQHFNIQSRQYRGAGFELVYWPQPQSPDVERLYFPEIGIDLVREVLFDRLSTAIQTDTQITGRGPGQDFERQTSALPFLVRAVAADFDPASPITRTLGDQALAWPSALRLDRERLDALGLSAEVLMTTSPRSWSYAWKGGWIPPEVLAGPPELAPGRDGGAAEEGAGGDAPDAVRDALHYEGRLPLAVLLEGRFPRPAGALRLDASAPAAEASPEDAADERPWPPAAPGRLLFLGFSEPFKDEHLDDPDFRADHLLENAVAHLALDPQLAAVAVRRRVPRGFGALEPAARLAWRAAVVGGGPLALVLLAGAWWLVRARPRSLPRAARSATGTTGEARP